MTTYYPKGGRCSACRHRERDCSALPFHTMPVHRRDGADVVVICTEYDQLNYGATLKHEPSTGRLKERAIIKGSEHGR